MHPYVSLIKVAVWGSIIFHYQAPWNKPIIPTSWPSALFFYNSGKKIIKLSQSDTLNPGTDRGVDRENNNCKAAWGNQSWDLLGKPGSRKGFTNTLSSPRLSTDVPLSNISFSWLMELFSGYSFSTIPQIHKTRLCAVSNIDIVFQYTHWLPHYIFNISFSWHYEPALRLEQ